MVWTETGSIRDRRILIVETGRHEIETGIDRWILYDPHHGKWSEEKGIFSSFCYCQGMFFSTHIRFVTRVFDVSSKKLLYEIPAPDDEKMIAPSIRERIYYTWLFRKPYIAESCREVLRVFWYYAYDILKDSAFHIYWLDFEGADEQPRWVKISDIGDQTLFLEVRNGFSMTAAPATGLRGGCIYFIDHFDGKPYVHNTVAGTVVALLKSALGLFRGYASSYLPFTM